MSYTPLDSGLIHSTIWRESSETRIVWITLLAMADRHDEVAASVPGLADAARVSLEQCEVALARLMGPDRHSRNKEFEGRRIEEIPGGWFILNRAEYRERARDEAKRALTAERVRRHKARKRTALAVTQGNAGVTQGLPNVDVDVDVVQTTTTTRANSARGRKAAANGTTSAPRTSWLTPYCAVWEATFGIGSTASLTGQMLKALAPLHKAHGEPEVSKRLAWYLKTTDAKWANITKFAQTFEAHNPDAPAFPEEDAANAADREWVQKQMNGSRPPSPAEAAP